MIANYHTHTRWCNHANGEIEDYIIKAIEYGLQEIAITEHVPHEDNIDYYRMRWEDFEQYNNEFDKLIIKYENKISIIKGLECEYYPDKMEVYKHFRDSFGYKLLVLGHHTNTNRTKDYFSRKSKEDILLYADEVCEGLNTGLFSFLAHPDVVLCEYMGFDETVKNAFERIFTVCEKMKIPVEINANGRRYNREYPNEQVWKLSKNYDLTYLINSDAHSPEQIYDKGVESCEKLADKLGINVLEKLQLLI